MTELIGEEIYDEFDPYHQGAQLSSFIPPDSDAGAKVTVLSADDPDCNRLDIASLTTGHDAQSTVGSELGHRNAPTVVKPIAVRAMEGFSAFTNRSRSAPPIQRVQVGKQPPLKSGIPPKTRDNNNSESRMFSDNGTNRKADISHLDLPTRSTNQTLNSYLLERKRKVVSGGEAIPRVVTPISVKGKGFKSSPLPAEMDITDGAMNKEMSNVTRG